MSTTSTFDYDNYFYDVVPCEFNGETINFKLYVFPNSMYNTDQVVVPYQSNTYSRLNLNTNI